MFNKTIDIVIPSYNGKHLLQKHLSEIVKNSPQVNNIIIVDDASIDGTEEWLKKEFPDVICLHHSKNIGFTRAVNIAAKYSKADFLVLLNNDVHPLKKYLDNALKYFDDEDVFAVTFNEENSSWPLISWTGKINYTRGEDKSLPRYSAWASGGSAVFRKSIWDQLGGLDEIYAPAYWEDIDIGYRAWKQGYKIIWDNHATVIHEHEASYSKFDPNYINRIKQRNELLFNWLNITDKKLVNDHKNWIMRYTITHPGYIKIIFSALTRYLLQGEKRHFKLSDKEVLFKVNQPI